MSVPIVRRIIPSIATEATVLVRGNAGNLVLETLPPPLPEVTSGATLSLSRIFQQRSPANSRIHHGKTPDPSSHDPESRVRAKLMRLAIVQMLIGLTLGMARQSPDPGKSGGTRAAITDALHDEALPSQAAIMAVPGPIIIPEGNGAPVITDGIFSPGEWDDALKIPLSEGGEVTLHLKEYRGVVFIGVRGQLGPSELSLAVPNGPIRKLHVSYALYEVVLPATGAEPRPRLGFTTDWYANEFRRDEDEFARLQKEGKDPRDIMRATSYPSDGIEFAIRRSKFHGQLWRMRLWASAVVADKPGMLTYPPATAERSTDGWLELRLR